MTRLQRLEKNNWRITTSMNTGNVVATKGATKVKGASITAVHLKVFGY